MLDVCQQWAREADMQFAAVKSFLMHLAGPRPAEGVAVCLGDSPLEWVEEFRYLGVTIKAKSRPTAKVPLEITKLWTAFTRLRHAMDPRLPVPLHAQLLLFVTDILAGPLYPAAVQDIDYSSIDVFVNKRVRQITGCPPHTSATLLRCELGITPSEFAAHRRKLQLWYHLHFEAWFWEELGTLVGTGPYQRLKATVLQYGLPTLDDGPAKSWCFVNEKGKKETYDKESWRKQVYQTVTSAAIQRLDEAAQARKYDGPVGTTGFNKSGSMQIEPRKYVILGGDLAKYGLQYRQALLQGQQADWQSKAIRRIGECKLCGASLGDLLHVVHDCTKAPDTFQKFRADVLQAISSDKEQAVRGLRQLEWKGMDEKKMRRALGMLRKASQLVSYEDAVMP
jgi:hypothetical protein